jgi:DhnA family fructose-bisphosphate aldolase class Ia
MDNKYRLNRLFRRDGRCVMIAVDHGSHNEYRLLDGVEDIDRTLDTVIEAGPDSILLTHGQARRLQRLPADSKPALVLRCDITNVYTSVSGQFRFCRLLDEAVEQAIRLDAAATLLNLFHASDNPSIDQQCIDNIHSIQSDCERYSMPLILEPLVLEKSEREDSYSISGRMEKVIALHRQAVELGADVLKADPSDSPDDYHKVIKAVGDVPLLPRGGGRVDARSILQRTEKLIKAGAAGVVYGRNIFQGSNPAQMVKAINAVVHDNADHETALHSGA